MNVDVRPDSARPGYTVVTPHGPIDSDTYIAFRERVQPLLVKTTRAILLDLKDVDYISSAGLGVLFEMRKYLLTSGGELLFCHLKPQIQRLFEIVKALPKESLFSSVEEADRYFYKIMNEEIEKRKKE